MELEVDLLKLPNLLPPFNLLGGRCTPTHLFITVAPALSTEAEATAGEAKLEHVGCWLFGVNKARYLIAVGLKVASL